MELMRRAIALAHAQRGITWPNPTVGCVIVRAGVVVGQAATGPGGPGSEAHRLHAEEQALEAAGAAAAGADVYLTLEPCAVRSSGRPSCAERLGEAQVARVFIACADPSAHAAGRGVARLRQAGVEVETGLLAEEAEDLYAGYKHRLATGLPLVEEASDGSGFDTAFAPDPGEDLEAALRRLGEAGHTRLWAPRGSALAQALQAAGLLGRGAEISD